MIYIIKVRAIVLLPRTACGAPGYSVLRTAVWLVTTAPWQPVLLPSGPIVRDFKNL